MKTEKMQKQDKSKNRTKWWNRKKKTRWSKKIKNALTNFKTFYQNVRGLKSKVDSIMETVSDYQAIPICFFEMHLQKEEEIRMPGYGQIFCNDRSGNRGCIMLAVKENIRTVTLEVVQGRK